MNAFGDVERAGPARRWASTPATATRCWRTAIARYLGIELGSSEVFEFANENIFVRILDNVREKDVFLVQPTCRPVQKSIMELLIMIDAFKRASAGRITAVVPYYAYGRSDKKDQPRVPITARLIADMISVAGADRLLTMDLHQGQIQGFFNIPVDELTAVHLLSDYWRQKELENLVVVTDLGFAKRARTFAELVGAPLAIIEKRREANDDRARVMNVIGEVRGKRAIIVDDEIDTAGTLVRPPRRCEREGALESYACATHGVLSDPAIDRIRESDLREVVITDTIPLPTARQLRTHQACSRVAPLIGEAITRIHRGESVGALFSSEAQRTPGACPSGSRATTLGRRVAAAGGDGRSMHIADTGNMSGPSSTRTVPIGDRDRRCPARRPMAGRRRRAMPDARSAQRRLPRRAGLAPLGRRAAAQPRGREDRPAHRGRRSSSIAGRR